MIIEFAKIRSIISNQDLLLETTNQLLKLQRVEFKILKVEPDKKAVTIRVVEKKHHLERLWSGDQLRILCEETFRQHLPNDWKIHKRALT